MIDTPPPVAKVKHPAKFSKTIIDKIREVLDQITRDWDYQPVVFDPFAGVGGIHFLRQNDALGNHYATLGLEIEHEWVTAGRVFGPMVCGDFFQFEWDRTKWNGPPDFIVTSPTYGNRFADKHEAKDGSVRRSYKHDLGRMPTDGSSSVLQWGKKYRAFHRKAWQRCYAMLDSSGYFVLNVSDHKRDFKTVPVVEFHIDACLDVGFELVQEHDIETPRMRMGQNHEARARVEKLFVLRKP
jgi:hypothetical protein